MPEVIQYSTVASLYILPVPPRPQRKVEEIVLHGPDPTEGSGPCVRLEHMNFRTVVNKTGLILTQTVVM